MISSRVQMIRNQLNPSRINAVHSIKHSAGRQWDEPGMGGKAMRRKRKLMLQWAIVAGLFVSLVLAFLLFWMAGSRAHGLFTR